jgi:hypothetical protein
MRKQVCILWRNTSLVAGTELMIMLHPILYSPYGVKQIMKAGGFNTKSGGTNYLGLFDYSIDLIHT